MTTTEGLKAVIRRKTHSVPISVAWTKLAQ